MPEVDDAAADPVRRHVDDEGTGGEVGERDVVGRGGVGSQDAELVVVTQVGDDLAVAGAECGLRPLPHGERHERQRPQVRLAGTLEIAFVVERLDRLVGRVAIGEVVGKRQWRRCAVSSVWIGVRAVSVVPSAITVLPLIALRAIRGARRPDRSGQWSILPRCASGCWPVSGRREKVPPPHAQRRPFHRATIGRRRLVLSLSECYLWAVDL